MSQIVSSIKNDTVQIFDMDEVCEGLSAVKENFHQGIQFVAGCGSEKKSESKKK